MYEKKNGYETHKLCMKLKQFLAQKGLTGEFYDWYVHDCYVEG